MSLVGRGTREFRIMNLAFFAAGFVTFMTLYDVQPLLPLFSREFRIDAAVSSLAISVCTGTLSVSMLIVGTLSETVGRKPVMVLSLLLTSSLALASALTRSFLSLLAVRLLQGFVHPGETTKLPILGCSRRVFFPRCGAYIIQFACIIYG